MTGKSSCERGAPVGRATAGAAAQREQMSVHTARLIQSQCYYDLDRYLFDRVTKRFEADQTLCAFDFYAIITWKANRAKTRVRSGLKTANCSPEELMRTVHDTADDRQKMQTLDSIPGIGIPIASAILTVCYPTRFTVMDYRAWETLVDLDRVQSKAMPSGIDGYFEQYLPVCQRLASEERLCIRELDQALWGWSQRKSIEEAAAP